MISWRFIKAFPVYFIAAVIFFGSVGPYLWWRWYYSPEKVAARQAHVEAKKEEVRKKVVTVENRLRSLLLVDNHLVDAETGEIYFKGWLEEGIPLALYVESNEKSLLAQYPNGFVRYGLDGTRQGALLHRYKLPFNSDHEWATFCKDNNVWRAEVDWNKLAFVNERQITKTGGFNERFFAENILFGTDRMLVVRNGNKMVKVTFESGEVAPVNYPLDAMVRRRSPNARYLVGIKDGKFFCHDVETNDTKTFPFTGRITDTQWIDDERCVILVAGQQVRLFNRTEGMIDEIASLPVQGDVVGEVSPSKRFVLTSSSAGVCVVNLEKKKAARIQGGEGIGWISDDTLFFSRDVLDSKNRGSWIQKAGESEKRVWEQPYLAGRQGALVTGIRETETVLFATKEELVSMGRDGSKAGPVLNFAKLFGGPNKVPSRIVGIKRWQSSEGH